MGLSFRTSPCLVSLICNLQCWWSGSSRLNCTSGKSYYSLPWIFVFMVKGGGTKFLWYWVTLIFISTFKMTFPDFQILSCHPTLLTTSGSLHMALHTGLLAQKVIFPLFYLPHHLKELSMRGSMGLQIVSELK